MNVVEVWTNEGQHSAIEAASVREAKVLAKASRTLGNKTVKVVVDGATWNHWLRTGDSRRNQWNAIRVHHKPTSELGFSR